MAEYKVPQDVEAEDKLLGPFSFRQFIYLIICAALVGLAVILFKIAIPLCVIPIPFILVLLLFALPLKKDQPMETYVTAIVMFHLKPTIRLWTPGQPENTIEIAAPKQIEEDRTNGLSQEEASHRLSFLTNLIDTEGYAIKGGTATSPNAALHDDIYAEAQEANDIFDTPQNSQLDQALINSANAHQQQIADSMRRAIQNVNLAQPDNSQTFTAPSYYEAPENFTAPDTSLDAAGDIDEYIAPTPESLIVEQKPAEPQSSVIVDADMPVNTVIIEEPTNPYAMPNESEATEPSTEIQPEAPINPSNDSPERTEPQAFQSTQLQPNPLPEPEVKIQQAPSAQPTPPQPNSQLVNLANNTDFSIETIAKEANRINDNAKQSDGEVYISLH